MDKKTNQEGKVIMADLVTIAQIVGIGAAALVIYKIYLETRAPTLKRSIPQYRTQPIVITVDGLKVAKEAIQLGNGKVHMKYEDGYSPIYRMTDEYSDIIELDSKQLILGKTRPVYIEHRKLLDLAYTYEHAPTRELMKQTLKLINKKLEKQEMPREEREKHLKEIKEIIGELNTHPKKYSEVVNQLGKEEGKSLKLKSDLRKQENGIDGRISRRIEDIKDVAVRRASKESDRD